jgi:hypothetical protein
MVPSKYKMEKAIKNINYEMEKASQEFSVSYLIMKNNFIVMFIVAFIVVFIVALVF